MVVQNIGGYIFGQLFSICEFGWKNLTNLMFYVCMLDGEILVSSCRVTKFGFPPPKLCASYMILIY